MKPFLLALLLAAATGRAVAVQTQSFLQDSFDDFAEGEARGITVTSDGFLRLGVEAARLAAIPASPIWAVAEGPGGALDVAAGNEGQVFRVGNNGKPEEIFKAKELQAQALAVDRHGALFVGTSPDGKIYRVEKSGKSTLFFEPKEKYIWALAFDAEGNLFAATGDRGKLFKISPSGKGRVFYDSDETHLRALLFDAKKRLWVGSAENGIVYRFETTAGAAGVPFAVWDSAFREITALAAAPDGAVFAAAMGDGKGARLPSLSGAAAAMPKLMPGARGDAPEAGAKGEAPGAPSEKLGAGEIARIAPDGGVERWWSDREDVYALAVPGPGRVWAGTGRKGKLLEMTGPRTWAILNQLPAETITALLPRAGGWIAATSNDGALWSLPGAAARKGSFESKIFDARGSARWGAVEFRASPGALRLFTRSGNTEKPDKVWSAWKPLDGAGRVQSPVAGYLQYKIEMEAEGRAEGPALDRLVLFYQPQNQPPRITRITVTPPHVELVRVPKPEAPLAAIHASANPVVAPAAGGAKNGAAANAAAASMMEAMLAAARARAPLLQPSKRLGWRSVTWQTNDPDQDELVAQIWYRALGIETWTLLRGDLRENFFAWDAARWPEGSYALKVAVSDLPSNLPADQRADEMTSEVFTVDHTAPEIVADTAPDAIKKGILSLVIRDAVSVVDEAEYSMDGAEWRPLLPVGGIYDSKENRFVIPIADLAPGEHYVNVRASDAADNVAGATIRFKK